MAGSTSTSPARGRRRREGGRAETGHQQHRCREENLAAAKSVAISTGPSGVYLNGLFERLGIMAELKPKLKIAPPAPMSARSSQGRGRDRLPAGERADPLPGRDFPRALPADLQKVTIFSGGVPVTSREPTPRARSCSSSPRPSHRRCCASTVSISARLALLIFQLGCAFRRIARRAALA